jgi:Sulfite oxidase and related enzymes
MFPSVAEAGIKPQAKQIVFYSSDRYHITLSLEAAQQDGVFLAHTVDGQILAKEHGYLLRLVVKGTYGNNWIKWVNRIEIE